MTKTPYEELGVGKDATEAEIRTAHRRRTKETHPDVGGSDEACQAVQKAYGVLSNPDKRAHYDQTGQTNRESAENEMMAKAIDYVSKLLGVYVAGEMDPGSDVRTFLIDQARQERQKVAAQKADTENKLKRIEAFAGRAKRRKRKSDAVDEIVSETKDAAILNQAVEFHRRGATTLIAECDEGLNVRDMAIGMLERHDYQIDQQPFYSYGQQQVFINQMGLRRGPFADI